MLRQRFKVLFLSFQILGTFLAYVIMCIQFAQSDSNPECESMTDVMVNTSTTLSD